MLNEDDGICCSNCNSTIDITEAIATDDELVLCDECYFIKMGDFIVNQ